MTRRDRYILLVIGLVALLGVYWLMLLAPKRDRVGKLDKDLTSAKQTLTQSQQEKVQFAQAQVQFPSLYASLGRLGKAVPPDQDVPSLLVQLNHAAAQASVDFRSIELKLDLIDKLQSPEAAATAAAAAAAPAAGATGATGATGASGSTATASTATAGTGAATGTLQPLPFQYVFNGNFSNLEGLLHNVSALVRTRNREVAVSGRLVVVEGFSMERGKITIVAVTYMLPADQGLFAGATPVGPAGTTAAAPQAASAAGSTTATPPTAAVTAP